MAALSIQMKQSRKSFPCIWMKFSKLTNFSLAELLLFAVYVTYVATYVATYVYLRT